MMTPQPLTLSDWALVIFVGSLVLAILGLLVDVELEQRGMETVTMLVRRMPWVGIIPVLIAATIPASLAVHFWL
jgi:hypothetical protein